jgi:hypothetical protein
MESGLPLPVQWGWRIMRAVHPDEMHGDVTASDAAIRELRAAATPFPHVPVVVLSAARSFPLPRRFRAHWTSLQAGLAAAAPQGRHVVGDGTRHNIPRSRPDVVAGTILAVAAEVRASGRQDRPGEDSPAQALRCAQQASTYRRCRNRRHEADVP